MHLLLTTKRPRFDAQSRIVPGQCDPDSDGWELRLLVDGVGEVLLWGPYRELRRIQGECEGMDTEAIRAHARAARERPGLSGRPPAARGKGKRRKAKKGAPT